jgi:formate hydrogenlyase transcriptional activator
MPPETHRAYQPDEEHNGRNSALARSDGPTLGKVVTGTIVGDLKHREPKLRQDEEESRRIVDLIPQHIVVLDSGERVIFANHQALEYTGLSLHEVRAGDVRERVFHPEDVERLREEREKGLAGAIPFQNEQRLLGRDGKYRWFLIRYNPLLDENGKAARWYATATDIDDRKRSESLRTAEMRALQMITDNASLTDVLNHVCTSIDLQISPSITTILLMDADGKRLWPSAGPRVPHDWARAITPLAVAPDTGLCGTAACLKTRVVMPDVATEPIFLEEYRGIALKNGIRAGWSQPILTKDNQVLGTFAIYSAESRVPTGEDLALIEAAGRIALIAIERQRSQVALRNAFDRVQKSEFKLRQVIDTIPTLVWSNLPDGSNEFLNRNWHEYTGLSPEESHGWGWQAAFHPEDLPVLMEKWKGMLVSGEAGEIEARLRRHDGTYRWFLIRAEPFRDEAGKIVRWYGTSTDIDDRKQAENKLRQGERELRELIDHLPQCVVVLDKEGVLLQTNKTMLDYNGYTLEEMRGTGCQDRHRRDLHPDDLERVQNERRAGLAGGVPFESEKRLLGKDGRYRWFLFRYKPVVNEDGHIVRWFATATDIEERKHAEERTRNENLALREQIDRDSMFEDIVGSSDALRKVLRQVAKVAPSDSTVMILGETGTGKELLARAIHKRSSRSERAFIGVNCAAIPPSLIASELFGHERGAFTGATQRRLGRFESANGGTVFLDEVGDLPPEIQIALLRVLQEREIERLGSNRAIPVDVRVLAATHRDLDTLIAEGKFRQDLLYRLSVVPIQMPSLRERADDIPVLVDYFIGRFGKKAGKKFRTIDKTTAELFEAYHWPGNVRELQNVIERAVILSEGDIFCVDETWLKRQAPQFAGPTVALNGALQRQEKEMIEAALAESGGRVSGPDGAATKLGLPRPTLEARIKRLGINKYRFKVQPPN